MGDLNQVILPDLSQFGVTLGSNNDPLSQLSNQFLSYGALSPQVDLLREGSTSPITSYAGVTVPDPGISLSTDFGQGAVASGNFAVAIGPYASALDASTVAVGYGSKSSRTYGVAIGPQANVSGYGSVAIGYAANAAGAYSVAIGVRAYIPSLFITTAISGTVAIGHATLANGSNNVVVGDSSTIDNGSAASTNNSTVVGQGISDKGSNDVAIGTLALVGAGGNNTVVGYSAQAKVNDSPNNTAVGSLSKAEGGSCVAVGKGANAQGTQSTIVGALSVDAADGFTLRTTILGYNLQANSSDQIVIGNSSTTVDVDTCIGRGVTHTGAAVSTKIRPSNGTGSNVAGDNLTLSGGRPTGSGVGGYVAILTAPAGSSSSTLQTLVERVRIDQKGNHVLQMSGALATNATDGFVYLDTCAGAPTGVPTSFTGAVASVYDTTNDTFNVYNGSWKSFSSGGGGGSVPDIQQFTASGTWTLPAGWTTAYCEIEVQASGGGAGGGGGSGAVNCGAGGGGGGSGEYKHECFTVTANQTVTINAAGTGGAGGSASSGAGSAGTDGGTATFGSLITSAGGLAGQGGASGAAAAGGAGGLRAASAGIFVNLSTTNSADLSSFAGSVGLKGGVGDTLAAQHGTGVQKAGESIPGYPAGGAAGVDSTVLTGAGGGGAATIFGSGGIGATGVDFVAGSIAGVAGGNAPSTSYGTGGGGGSGAAGGASPKAGGAGGNGANGYVRVFSWKVN